MSRKNLNTLIVCTLILSIVFISNILTAYTYQADRNHIAKDFTSRYGSDWRFTWNDDTGLPHRIMGEGIYVGKISTPSQAENVCRGFILTNPTLFPVDISDLNLACSKERAGTWYVIFDQKFNGIPVHDARIHFRIKHDHIILIGSDIHPNIDIDTNPTLSFREAAEIAQATEDFKEYESELVVFPKDGYHLAWWLRTVNPYPLTKFNFYIDAHDGELLLKYDDIRYEFGGYVMGEKLYEYPTDDLELVPFPYVFVETEEGVNDTANEFGVFIVPFDAPSYGVGTWINLRGLYADVVPVGTSRAMWGEFCRNDSLYYINFTAAETETAEVNVYYHTNLVHDWYKAIDPDFDALDYPMPVVVNDTVSPTPDNAFWDGTGMHFGAGNSCNNFGHFSDVVYHEYTHGVTHFIYPMGGLEYTGQSGAMDEAFSDYFACTILDDCEHGEDVCSVNPFRNLDNVLRYPDNWVGEVHADGAIISGAFWDMRELFGRNYTDSLVHFARYGWAENFEDFLIEVLVVDDDDGNLANGSPHFWEIYDAFQAHGIGEFRVEISHEGRPDTEDTESPYPISAKIVSTIPLEEDSTLIYYSIGGLFSSTPLTSTGDFYDYTGEIPPQSEGTTVYYYIFAMDTFGNYARLPEEAPDMAFSFYVGQDTIHPYMEHSPLEDQALELHPYFVKAKAKDNLGIDNLILIYQHNDDPLDTLEMEGDTLDGYHAYMETPTVAVGDSFKYKLLAVDAALAHNVTTFPEEGFHKFKVVKSIFFDFEEGESDFISTDDWQWGTPTETGPETAFSGEKCWGTNIGGNHSDNSNSELVTPPLDLSDFSCATLEFYHFYQTETTFDGGNVKISTDDGYTWNLIYPIQGYPMFRIRALDEEGFSGFITNWERVQVDLLPYVGSTVKFKFHFMSDEYSTRPGWYIDDVGVLEKQILLPPTSVRATSGYDSRIMINWKAPSLATARYRSLAPESFTGYNVYRTTVPGEYGDAPINLTAITDTSYIDLTAVNEVEYYYIVKSVYTEGESKPSNETMAMAFNADIGVTPDSFHITMPQRTELDTFLTISNLGSGYLEYNIFEEVTPPEESPFRKISHETDLASPMIPPGGEWRLLATDPDEEGVELNLAALYAQHASNFLYFLVTAHNPMGDPTSDFVLAFALDTDCDPSTGDGSIPGMGIEFMVAIGALPMGWEGQVLEYAPESPYGWMPTGEPHWYFFPEDGDSVGCGITFSVIDNPEAFTIAVFTVRDLMSMPYPEDILPDDGSIFYSAIEAAWITESPVQGVVYTTSPQDITLSLNSGSLPPADYQTWLKIVTNDWDAPLVYVPVTLTVIDAGIDEPAEKPLTYSLGIPYPNPSNISTYIEYSIPEKTPVKMEIYNILGKKIVTLLDDVVTPGKHKTLWDGIDQNGKEIPSGIYFYRFETQKFKKFRKVLILK
ncbi:T9SS type A sorting domain-containing protein [bacterium]|nr:T9SS type A sorting domain-containing protein [bacterium]